MAAHFKCKLLFAIYTALGIVPDIQRLIVRLYYDNNIFRETTSYFSGKYHYSINAQGFLTYRGLDVYIPQRVVSIHHDDKRNYALAVDGDLYCSNSRTDNYHKLKGKYRYMVSRDKLTYAVTDDNFFLQLSRSLDPSRSGPRAQIDMGYKCKVAPDIYKLTISTGRVYWLTNAGEVFVMGNKVPFVKKFVELFNPAAIYQLQVDNVIDIAGDRVTVTFITADRLHIISAGHTDDELSYQEVYYGDVDKLRGTHKLTLGTINGQRLLVFHNTNEHPYPLEVGKPFGF